LPVVFNSTFPRPSLYTFFTGREATAISSLYSRQTQFDIWQFEKKYNNKPAFISLNPKGNVQIYISDSLQFGGFRTDSLQTVNRMKISFRMNETSLNPGDSVSIPFSMLNQYDYDIDFGHRQFPVEVFIAFLKGEEEYFSRLHLRNLSELYRKATRSAVSFLLLFLTFLMGNIISGSPSAQYSARR